MEKFVINGGNTLKGAVDVSGAKNAALKALVAACLTNEKVVIHNIPLVSDFFVMLDIVEHLGGKAEVKEHTVTIHVEEFASHKISLDAAAKIRTSSLLIAPLLARTGKAIIPNPGGCRIGARPIDRTVQGLRHMGAEIDYESEDGFFHASVKKLKGTHYRFEKNTHTGTETLILAAVLAEGKTILENAASEPEVDELISLLNSMGAKVQRTEPRTIVVEGVERLHGTTFTIGPDRNEIVTFAVAAHITGGNILVKNVRKDDITTFLKTLEEADGGFQEEEMGMRFFSKGQLKPTHVTTAPHPGFMTDWQGPWTILMTQAHGVSIMHETVYENRFGFVKELNKMGAHIELFNPKVDNAKEFYNFNLEDDTDEFFHAARITGPTNLHNAVLTISDLRAGATLVLAALAAKGENVVFGIEHLDRGYENFDKRLRKLGARIKRVEE